MLGLRKSFVKDYFFESNQMINHFDIYIVLLLHQFYSVYINIQQLAFDF